MCGIAGFIQKSPFNALESLNRMVLSLHHRGPNGNGIWFDPSVRVGFGHCRLAIVDFSEAGNQPMLSPSERYVIIYNGEVFNAPELREELRHSSFKPHGYSDTEIILILIEELGIELALPKLNGIYAFALFDRKENKLHLAVDRIGVKPLYYGWINSNFVFASELKAFHQFSSSSIEIDRDALSLLIRHTNIPAPYSIFKDVFKLIPGCYLTLEVEGEKSEMKNFSPFSNSSDKILSPYSYWSLKNIAEQGVAQTFTGEAHEAAEVLESMLSRIVKRQMPEEVPFGIFFSGGIDSSILTALMQANSTSPIQTFTMGFAEVKFDESQHAQKVADFLGAKWNQTSLTPDNLMQAILQLGACYDEPFADSSQIPTMLVSEFAKEKVTVIMCGDGGDELFCGYDYYFKAEKFWNRTKMFPLNVRIRVKALLQNLASRINFDSQLLKEIILVLDSKDGEHLYNKLCFQLDYNESPIVLGGSETRTIVTDRHEWANVKQLLNHVMFLDMKTYLPNDLLVKIDRATMASSIEARVPFLDHELIEFVWSLPLSLKYKNGESKWILRNVLGKYIPRELFTRRKQGFGIPLDSWLRGSLRDWAEELLDENLLMRQGFFNVALVQHRWKEHLNHKRNWGSWLWSVLSFQLWLEHYNQDIWYKRTNG